VPAGEGAQQQQQQQLVMSKTRVLDGRFWQGECSK